MLRWTMLLLAGALVTATSAEADENATPAKPENAAPVKSERVLPPKPKSRVYGAVRQLPPGLPRAGYRFRTTVAPATPYRDPVVYETDADLLITPAYGPNGYTRNLPGTPILPGSTTIPGYYGRAFSYDYRGPYYGGPYEGYFWRLPYACGVYGYCYPPALAEASTSDVAPARPGD